ncbi:hypothetical protein [Euzebyella saccharophila]|uniref:Uncharacterized protein n=1 Tax=Euzebyella saccharophila TaxID=679664 RepID=A0ABV8JJF4_9FLAO|nr:hypothetical protein [Euzebyella saccharophila]
MKTIITFVFVLFIGLSAQAQTKVAEVKVETIEMTVVTTIKVEKRVTSMGYQVARLYKRDNARVKKELSFTTKYNRAKMA